MLLGFWENLLITVDTFNCEAPELDLSLAWQA